MTLKDFFSAKVIRRENVQIGYCRLSLAYSEQGSQESLASINAHSDKQRL